MALAGGGAEERLTLGRAQKLLEKFIERNNYSKIEEDKEGGDGSTTIKLPWNDKSLDIKLPVQGYAPIIDALNNVILPERFTALWHVDKNALEVIYTALPLVGSAADMRNRSFQFTYAGKIHKCEFAKSSDRLLHIANFARPIAQSSTDYRNLTSLWRYLAAEAGIDGVEKIEGSEPISFWVHDLEWSQENLVELCRHLNFYMSYYDTRSPIVIIHAPKQDTSELKPRERYIAGSFPKNISASELNSSLLHYWNAAHIGDPFRRFLYNYQIIEYAAFYHIEDSVKRQVRKTLAAPNALDEIDKLIVEIMDQMQDRKIWEGDKMAMLLRETVDAKLIWREIEKNMGFFTKKVEFEGGFTLDAFRSEKDSFETFSHNWHSNFSKTVRNIRNGLSHAKEQSMSAVITPTPANFTKIQPWLSLISVTAGEVMVYAKAI